jgi:hypothetical protein
MGRGGMNKEGKIISTNWKNEFVLFALQETHAIIRFVKGKEKSRRGQRSYRAS